MIETLGENEIVGLIRKMSNGELHASAVQTAERERKITLALLRHLNEIDRRRLYSKFNVSSLHAYCVQELKFDDGSAGRRVSAARLLRDIPLVEEKIASGSVSLTSVSKAGIFFRKEARAGNSFSTKAKRDLLLELENKSTRQVDQILLSKSDQPEIHFKEKIVQITALKTAVTVHLDEETMKVLGRLKELWSHANPHATLADTIKRAAKEAVEVHDPLKKIERAEERANKRADQRTSAQKSDRTSSKAQIKRAIWRRDGARCTFTDPRTGARCESRYFLEEDHIRPQAVGGEYSLENIRLRCRAHNQRHAIDFYGFEKMKKHLET